MNYVAGPVIVFALGVGTGALFHNAWSRRFWIASIVATIAATALWIGGCYLLFVLAAPNELGPPLLVPVLLTLATALIGAVLAGVAVRWARKQR